MVRLVNKNSNESESFSRPKDKSLASYKAWIFEITRRLTTQKTEMKLTDEEWVANWKEYWKDKSE
jgi:hypothetical protein